MSDDELTAAVDRLGYAVVDLQKAHRDLERKWTRPRSGADKDSSLFTASTGALLDELALRLHGGAEVTNLHDLIVVLDTALERLLGAKGMLWSLYRGLSEREGENRDA
jgi:hypothetical protein